MTSNIKCNTCGNIFDVKEILTKRQGDYEVQYFVCPHCRRKYQIITTDSELREMIKQRIQLNAKFQFMRNKNFKKETIQKLETELSKVKEASERMAKDLKEIGERILMQEDESSAI